MTLLEHTYDLTNGADLSNARGEAGSWAALSRSTGIPASTLKSRGKRLGVRRELSSALIEVPWADPGEQENRARWLASRRDDRTKQLAAAAARSRRESVEAGLVGKSDEVDFDEFMMAVEIDTLIAQSDHQRLLRVAKLAIDYYRVNPAGHTQHKFFQKVADACQVNLAELKAYCLVLGKEIRYRESAGEPPLDGLPRLLQKDAEARAASVEYIRPASDNAV